MNAANFSAHWHVIAVKKGMERKVSDSLERRKIETYCPVHLTNGSIFDRRKHHSHPLFSGLVFFKSTPEHFETVLNIDGVVSLMYWLNQPAIVPEEEIETINRFLSEYDKVTIEKNVVNPEEQVRIVNGPLIMWEGNIVEVKTNIVKIVLPTIGYSLVAEIQTELTEETEYAGALSKAI